MVMEQGPSSSSEKPPQHEVVVADPENPEAHGIMFNFLTHDEPIYHQGWGARPDETLGKPNMNTAWQRMKLRFLRAAVGSARPVNVKYLGLPNLLLHAYDEMAKISTDTGMRVVAGETDSAIHEGIDDIDDEDGAGLVTSRPTDHVRAIGVFSPVDGRDKFSENYKDCAALIGFGDAVKKDAHDNGILSFLSHINIQNMLEPAYRAQFREAIRATVLDLRDRSQKDSLRLTIVCGDVLEPRTAARYWAGVKEIGRIADELGVTPQIMIAPNTSSRGTVQHVYVKTNERNVHISQPPQQQDHEKWREPLSLTFKEFLVRLDTQGIPA